MSTCWLIADTHFGHANLLSKIKGEDGLPLRLFSSIEEMHRTIIENWNSRVKANDIVYHLGDVAFGKNNLHIMGVLNGKKILIKGNHDNLPIEQYMLYFSDVRSYKEVNGSILSHIPIHESSLTRYKYNIHGHIHRGQVMKDSMPDRRYINVSVEQTGYRPITIEEAFNTCNS